MSDHFFHQKTTEYSLRDGRKIRDLSDIELVSCIINSAQLIVSASAQRLLPSCDKAVACDMLFGIGTALSRWCHEGFASHPYLKPIVRFFTRYVAPRSYHAAITAAQIGEPYASNDLLRLAGVISDNPSLLRFNESALVRPEDRIKRICCYFVTPEGQRG